MKYQIVYGVVSSNDDAYDNVLSERVSDAIKQGWELHGPPAFVRHSGYGQHVVGYQAMIRKAEVE